MSLQFQSNFSCTAEKDLESAVLLGRVDESLVEDQLPMSEGLLERPEPHERLEREATSIRPPRGGNVLAPVDDVSRSP